MTVHIFREIYERYKHIAESERYQTKGYLNQLLSNYLEKEEFIKAMAPYLSIDSCENDRMVIKDTKERKLIDVYLRDLELQCEFHNSTDCIHTRYVWASPELGQLATAVAKSKKKLMTATMIMI